LLYSKLINPLSKKGIYAIISEAVLYEKEFVSASLPVELIGMNSKLMSQYIEFVADRLLYALGYDKLWNTQNPFDWMEMISLEGKTNFLKDGWGNTKRLGLQCLLKMKQMISFWMLIFKSNLHNSKISLLCFSI